MKFARTWLPRPRAANPVALDVAVALALGALELVYLRSPGSGSAIAAGAVAILGAAFLGVYSATVPAGSPASLRGLAIASIATLGAIAVVPAPFSQKLISMSLPFAVFVLCRVQLSRQLAAEMMKERAAELERTQAEVAARAVADERARIARELHDMVAHHVGVMVVQADGAGRAIEYNPAAAREAIRVIGATGRDALSEMHRLVGLLRVEDENDGLAPQPTLDSLPVLVEQIRASGLEVSVSRYGDVRPLAAGIELAAYRIVQEALMNVLKHAHAAQAEVRIMYQPDSVRIDIVNGGAAVQPPRPGHGLVGMRERVAIYGGSLTAGPRSGGGFEVSATIPTRSS